MLQHCNHYMNNQNVGDYHVCINLYKQIWDDEVPCIYNKSKGLANTSINCVYVLR